MYEENEKKLSHHVDHKIMAYENRFSESEKERLKRIMALPVNPKSTGSFYFMQNFRHRKDNEYNLRKA